MGGDIHMIENEYLSFRVFPELLDWIDTLSGDGLKRITLWWVVKGEHPYVLKCPSELYGRAGQLGGEVIKLSQSPRSAHQSTLDLLWRYARPYRSRAGRAPDYWLFIIEEPSDQVYRELAVSLKMGGQLITCAMRPLGAVKGGDQSFSTLMAVRSSGPDADLIASRLLMGVNPVGVYVEERVRAGLPPGWSPPLLPEACWPADDELIIYQDLDEIAHSLCVLEVIDEGPQLVNLVTWRPAQLREADAHGRGVSLSRERFKLKVDQRSPSEMAPLALGSNESNCFVFRFKSKIGQFSSHLIQAINQLEGGMLPELAYAALDWDESFEGPERWHFVYAEHMTVEQLSAWSLIDRYELNEPLERFGLPNVFVGSGSQVTPPLELLVDSNSARSIDSLKELLHGPSRRDITLVEHNGESDGAPLITKISVEEMRPFAEVLIEITEGWNGDVLQLASAELTLPNSVLRWQSETERRLSDIATFEHEALKRTNSEALAILREEGQRAIEAMEAASEPVIMSTGIARELAQRIIDSDQNYARVCASLAAVSRSLTEPRRSWISDQTANSVAALDRSSPLVTEASEVRETTETLVNQLSERAAALQRGSEAIVNLQERWGTERAAAEQAAEESARQREALAAAARDANARIARAQREVDLRMREAQAINARLVARQAELEAERRAIETLVSQNSAIEAENNRNETEYKRRRDDAEKDHDRLIKMRDVTVPRLKLEAERMKQKRDRLKPKKIELDHDRAKARHDELTEKLKAMKQKREATQSLVEQHKSNTSELQSQVESHERDLAQEEDLRQELIESNEELKELKSALNRIRSNNAELQSEGVRNKDIRIKRELMNLCSESLGRRSDWRDQWILFLAGNRAKKTGRR